MTERASELISASAEIGFCDADAAELLKLAKADAEIARELTAHFEMHNDLQLAMEPDSASEREKRAQAVLYYIQVSTEQTRFFKRVEAKIQSRPSNRQRRSILPRRLRWFGFFAAGVVMAAGAYVLLFNVKGTNGGALPTNLPMQAPVRTIAFIQRLDGSAELIRNGTSRAVHTGFEVLANDEVKTLANGTLELHYLDGTNVAFSPLTQAMLKTNAMQAKLIQFERGALAAQVSKQPKNAPMQIVTPHAVIRVLGTEFRLEVTERDSQLELKTGTVRVTQVGTNRSIELQAGNCVRVAPKTEMTVTKLLPGTFLIDDFESGKLSDWLLSWPAHSKSQITHRLVAGKTGKFAMHVDYRASNNDWAWTVCEKFMDNPQDWSAYTGIQFWFKGTGSGNAIMCEVFDNGFPEAKRYQLERFRFQFYDTGNDWRLVRLPFTQFYREETANTPNDGFDRKQAHAIGFVVNDVSGSFDVDDIRLFRDVKAQH